MRFPRARLVIPAVLLAAAVGTGVPAALLYQDAVATEAAQANRAPASAATKARLEQVLSYRFTTIDQDLTAAKADTTGEFGQQFAVAADQIIAAAARQAEITTTATVVSTAVVDAHPDEVVVLAFVNQTTTTKDKPQPATGALRLRVTLERAGGQWLISRLAQV
ncbi:MAG TPA: hypothetical protein VHC18_28065 [Amycolatopsis sp.]|nr:hypothetical protein [Amycolatopsis sp.]